MRCLCRAWCSDKHVSQIHGQEAPPFLWCPVTWVVLSISPCLPVLGPPLQGRGPTRDVFLNEDFEGWGKDSSASFSALPSEFSNGCLEECPVDRCIFLCGGGGLSFPQEGAVNLFQDVRIPVGMSLEGSLRCHARRLHKQSLHLLGYAHRHH